MENVEQRVNEVINDREHGSRWLVKGAITLLRDLAQEEVSSQDEQMRTLLKSAYRMAQARPAMEALSSSISRVTRPYERGLNAIKREANRFLKDFEESTEAIAYHAAPHLFGQMMTCSLSGTVLDVLSKNSDRFKHVTVLEGRPRYEGREMARQLSERRIRVSLITDAQADIFLEGCHGIIVGADSVLASGDVLNKAGTALLGWAAKGRNVPMIVVCESWKISPKRWLQGRYELLEENAALLEEKEPEEVLEHPIAGVEVRNFYFDHTPFKLVLHLITELGELDRKSIREIAARTQENERILASVQKGL